jgi:PAS domain S-box-containing protein
MKKQPDTASASRGWTQEASEAFLESSPDAVVIIDSTGEVVLVNRQTESLFGFPRSRVVGQPVEMLLPERFRRLHLSHRAGYAAQPKTRPMGAGVELFGLRSDGSEFPIDISLSALATEQGTFFAAAIRDITDRRRAEEKFRSFLESAPDAVVVIERDGRVAIVNAQTETLFGYPRAAMLGQPVEMLLPERFHGSHVAQRAQYAAEPKTRPMGAGGELFGLRSDGSEFPIDISLSPLDTEDGLLLAATVRDVTERKRLETARDEFILHAAHELRTPLATLATLGETLASHMDEMSPENVSSALGALKRQGERASTMIANLLDLSQLDGGRAVVHLEPVSLAALAHRVIEGAPPPAGTTIVIEIDEALVALADPVQLDRVLTNLLTNAYRYGGPHIDIGATPADGGVLVFVSDDGDGVPDGLVPDVFEAFARGKSAGAVGGSGIGLALCRRIVTALGGRIWYAGSDNGARFNIRLRSAR